MAVGSRVAASPGGRTGPAVSGDVERCSCWFGPVVLHSGHCCFRKDQVGPVYCHRVDVTVFPDAPAGDVLAATSNSEFVVVADQLALLPPPAPDVRRLAPVPAQDAARPVVDLEVVGGRL